MKPIKSWVTNPNVDNMIPIEAEVVDDSEDETSVDLDDLDEDDLILEMSSEICLVVDLDDEEDLVSVKVKILNKP